MGQQDLNGQHIRMTFFSVCFQKKKEYLLFASQKNLKNEAKGFRKKKSLWVRQWISRRNSVGASNSLCFELRNEDPSSYKNLTTLWFGGHFSV